LESEEEQRLPHGRITGDVIRLFFRVYDRLGFGFLESVYAKALAHELTLAGIQFDREALVDIWYDAVCVGQFRADFLVERRVILELKATATLSEADRRQLLNCLRCSQIEVGLLLHFGPKAWFQRVLYTNDRKQAVPNRT
jgi:GxxExxY protein